MVKNVIKKIAAGFALFTVELLVVWGLYLALILLFWYIGSLVMDGQSLGIDEAAFSFSADISTPFYSTFLRGITFLGSRYFLTIAALLLIFFFIFIRRHRWHSLKVPVIALGSISLNQVLKYWFNRPRPILPDVEATGLSFPSGHTMVAASFYGLIIYLVWRNLKPGALRVSAVLLLSIIIILIGFSRIYFRVHYASDVLAGFAAGFLWLMVGLWLLRKMEKLSSRNISPVLEEDKSES